MTDKKGDPEAKKRETTVETTNSLTPIISEDQFLPIIKEKSRDLDIALSILADESVAFNKMHYYTLLMETEKLEGMLDDYGARTNAKWLYFTELIASVRNFAIAGFHLSHLTGRYKSYLDNTNKQQEEDLRGATKDTLEFFLSSLRRFHTEMIGELGSENITIPVEPRFLPDWRMAVNPKLPHTIDLEEASGEEERMISIAQSYRRVYKEFLRKRLNRKVKVKTMPELIPSVVNEIILAEMESALHNIQSEFDTYIRGGALEKKNDNVQALRGHTAIPMHLVDSMRWLIHFYERHEGEIRKSDVKSRISKLVDDELLFSCITGFGLRYIGKYLEKGNNIAERLLSSFVMPVALKLPVPKPQGFHARPSTYVSMVVQEHGTDVFMSVDDERYNCRSVLDMLQAGGILAERGDSTVIFEGDQRVLDDIKILSEKNYCEDQDIPPELHYLRIMRNL